MLIGDAHSTFQVAIRTQDIDNIAYRYLYFQQIVLKYLATQFELGVLYTEREVNALLNQDHTFGDPALLRRELFERGLVDRVPNGSAYWLNK